MEEPALTVNDVLGLIPGSLIEMAKGEARIVGRYDRMQCTWGYVTDPCLILDAAVGNAYNPTKLIEHGWTLTVLETP